MGFNPHDVLMMQQRLAASRKDTVSDDAVAGGDESVLHDEIIAWCVTNGLAYIHSPMHKKATQTPGSPDFVIVQTQGRIKLIECKTRTGKLSQDQLIWHHLAGRAGTEVCIVRSMREFYEAMT